MAEDDRQTNVLERIARELDETIDALPYPRIEEGAHTMAFIEACAASQAQGGWRDVTPLAHAG